ncbi:hypothetical protein RNJ44_03435 [Nakaseomyces bracarensis]|uniref:Uncharacterized protein n=1 Tax=Nakaseomyces bracarensis TaxID=273131 RepID=A0ABR4NWX8_9SACH
MNLDKKDSKTEVDREIHENIQLYKDDSGFTDQDPSKLLTFWHGLRFGLNFIFILPFKVIFSLTRILLEGERRINGNILVRVFMRECVKLTDPKIWEYVLNPIFEAIYKSKGAQLKMLKYEVPTEDLQVSKSGIFDKPFVKNTSTESKFFWEVPIDSNTFNPETDPILIYYHGGGYALKLTPTTLSFLFNTGKRFPGMPIIVSDYAPTASSRENNKYPRQLLDILAVYDYVTETLGCRNVILMGDSAGGNAVLMLLLYLINHGRTIFPKKAIPISPWLNTTYLAEKEKIFMKKLEKWDYISMEVVQMFGELYVSQAMRNENYDHINDEYINIEHNFKQDTWQLITDKCDLLVTFGEDEILRYQIEEFIGKLISCNPKKFTWENNVFSDYHGAHTGPVLAWETDVDLWAKQPSVHPIIQFLKR